MRKLLTVILPVLTLLVMSTTALAATDSSDDISNLTDEIITTTNDLLSDKLPNNITSANINYDNAYKIYVGTNVFKMDTTNINDLTNAFGSDGYIYELPIYIDGNTIIVNIAKGQPLNENAELTEAERQEILSKVGKWSVTGVKYYEGETVNYKIELQKMLNDVPKNVILVGGLPHFRYAVALIADDEGNVQELVPLSNVPGVENINSFRTSFNRAYDYVKLKEYVNQLPEESSDEMGSYGFSDTNNATHSFKYIFIVGGIAVILCVTGGFYIFRRKSAK